MQTAIVKSYSTLENLMEAIDNAITTTGTYSDFKEMRDYVRFNKPEIINLISKKKLPELKKIVYTDSRDNKERIVEKVYKKFLWRFMFISTFMTEDGESTQDAFHRFFEAQTEDDYNTWIADKEKKQAEFEKALTNPETKEEFQTFIKYEGASKLTSEQRARYDELRADESKEHRQKEANDKAQIKAVDVPESLTFTIKESIHTQKKIPLWVVVISERVDKEKFYELKAKAHALDGYYSSYAKDGAIPGFTFEHPEGAELFANLKNGNVDASAIHQAIAEEKKENRIESLKEKAERMLAEATEELQRERKDNTHRRARMAANAENEAIRKIEFAKTMIKIAEAIENGIIKYLDKLANITDLETLLDILVSAKWKHIKAKELNYSSYEITAATAEFVMFPYPVLYKGDDSYVYKMRNTKGKIMAAGRMIKRLAACKEFVAMYDEKRLDDYEILFCNPCKEISIYQAAMFKENLMKFKRVKRMHIETDFELRAALRELINIKAGINITPEEKRLQQIRELERSFLHQKIDGFFPTTPELGTRQVAKADIQEGHTICEPNAGLGHLAEIISDKHPENFLQCIEINSRLVEALKIKGFETIHDDFLTHDKTYDRIILNPPFENLQDIDHVTHAYKLLNPGGRLVATMANNKQRKDAKVKTFMELVDNNGSKEENPPNSFASAFRPTGVSTITVILDKPF